MRKSCSLHAPYRPRGFLVLARNNAIIRDKYKPSVLCFWRALASFSCTISHTSGFDIKNVTTLLVYSGARRVFFFLKLSGEAGIALS